MSKTPLKYKQSEPYQSQSWHAEVVPHGSKFGQQIGPSYAGPEGQQKAEDYATTYRGYWPFAKIIVVGRTVVTQTFEAVVPKAPRAKKGA